MNSPLLKIVGSLISHIELLNNELIIHTTPHHILPLINYLKYNSLYKYEQLIDITAIDNPDQPNRFTIVYQLLSISRAERIRIKLTVDEFTPVESISSIYPSSNWYEREVWDLFGVFFLNHPDLRRILNDYGFIGHPFRKDFPLTGYVQVRYDDEVKRVITEPIELSADLRHFNNQSYKL